jgi:hypothetical protein
MDGWMDADNLQTGKRRNIKKYAGPKTLFMSGVSKFTLAAFKYCFDW